MADNDKGNLSQQQPQSGDTAGSALVHPPAGPSAIQADPKLCPPISSPGSFVYPVRSLLSGITPREQRPRKASKNPPRQTTHGEPTSDDLSYVDKTLRGDPSLAASRTSASTSSAAAQAGNIINPQPRHAASGDGYFHQPHLADSEQSESQVELEEPRSDSDKSQAGPSASAIDARSFQTPFPSVAAEGAAAGGSLRQVKAPDGTTITFYRADNDRDPDEETRRHPPPFSAAAAEALVDAKGMVFNSSGSTAGSSSGSSVHEHTLADSGLVHLPPIRPSSQNTDATSSVYTSRTSSRSADPKSSGSVSESVGYESDEHLVTFRFEHVEDENGHLVVVGRDGQLTKCEDEPIRTPNAVQGYGVLVAVHEDEDSGNLVVRQVSENSFELLGLSPQYLFGLDCFTQTLPDTQADILWDNVQFLTDPDSHADEPNDVPHVFLLSGWGEPDSALTEDGTTDKSEKRFWTCWCAAHRPPPVNAETPSILIILEFELERDLYNPLYPPFQSSSAGSSRESAGSGGSKAGGSSGGGSTDDSQITITGSNLATGGTATPSASVSLTAPVASSSTPQPPSSVDSTPAGIATITPPDSTSSAGSEAQPQNVDGQLQPLQSALQPADPSALQQQNIEQVVMSGYVEDEFPTPEDILESTTSYAKPLRALERMRQISRRSGGSSNTAPRSRKGRNRGGLVGTMDVFAVLTQINDQLGSAPDLDIFLKVVVGVIKDLTQFHRVLVYQFDESWNGQAVAELVDWSQTHELYRGLHFPASDIPAQARQLYTINKVRILYDRSQTTARLVVRTKEDLDPPLDMTHSYLRAMSPIHLKYLGNMGVRASMSISIMAFGSLWGLIACHSYGVSGMRVSFPVRQMLRLLSDSISRNIERLSYAKRLHTRKLISTLPTDTNPTGYIVSNAEDLLSLFDADFGVLVIGEGAKILGPNQRGQEILIVAEYLRMKQFNLMQVSQHIVNDFPDLHLPSGIDVIAGLLYVPLSSGGKDFIAFLRKGQLRDVRWAGKPFKEDTGPTGVLEPRTSFKTWSQTIAGRCRAWTDEQLETAGVLALVYGKFIEVWRQKESALQSTQLTSLLLANASHEVRTPLNHIINYLELALSSSLDTETRENLMRSHTASKSLLFTINDLLDLTRLESGNETSFNEPFDLRSTIMEATHLYIIEATRRNIEFKLDIADSPQMVLGDSQKIRTVVANLTANAVKYTTEGTVVVESHVFKEGAYLSDPNHIAVEIVVSDTGCGIAPEKLESIFREFEQVESAMTKTDNSPGLGLGLAVVARIVEQLGGQLRVDSEPNQGSRFSFLIPFTLCDDGSVRSLSPPSSIHSSLRSRSRTNSSGSGRSQIDSIVQAISSDHMIRSSSRPASAASSSSHLLSDVERLPAPAQGSLKGSFQVGSSRFPLRPAKVDEYALDRPAKTPLRRGASSQLEPIRVAGRGSGERLLSTSGADVDLKDRLRILIVEDDRINRTILAKRLTLDGHDVVNSTNGQDCVDKISADPEFDCVLMDIQMPILNGFDATVKIREMERTKVLPPSNRQSGMLNGRIPIFAVSASLLERQRHEMYELGMDGWVLKPIDFTRLGVLLRGIHDLEQRSHDVYSSTSSWERGGWLAEPLAHLGPAAAGH